MKPEDLKVLLEAAKAALAAGRQREEVEAAVRDRSGMSLEELQRAAGPGVSQAPPLAAQIGTGLGMGATAGALDEIIAAFQTPPTSPYDRFGEYRPDVVTPEVAREKYRTARERVLRTYGQTPGAVRIPSEIAGAFATPAGLFGHATRTMSIPRAMGRGAVAGAVGGAAAGAGYAPELEDVPGRAIMGGLFGSAIGSAVPFVPGIAQALVAGTGGQRLARAVAAGGGPGPLRTAAREAVETGYGDVTPIAALSPYLTKEAGFAARRVPEVGPKFGTELAAQRAGEAERLIAAASRATGGPAAIEAAGTVAEQRLGLEAAPRAAALASRLFDVPTDALKRARSVTFKPLYRALDAMPNPLVTRTADAVIVNPELAEVLNRPVVRAMLRDAVQTSRISAEEATQPGFVVIRDVLDQLADASDEAIQAGGSSSRRGFALKEAMEDLERIAEEANPAFRIVQESYREASRPLNVIELARLEKARQAGASVRLDKADLQLKQRLQRAFGSQKRYDEFMAAVEQERKSARLMQEAFGGSETAGRLLGEGAQMGAEDVAEATARTAVTGSAWPFSGLIGGMVPRAMRERAGRQTAPLLFRPSRDVENVLAQIEAMRGRQAAPNLFTSTIPGGLPSAALGLFPEEEPY